MAAPNVDLFDSYFRKADLDRDGRISGAEAVGFFQGSGLPMPILAQIWMHADRNKIGFLGRAEFYNALKLVTVAQSKRELTPDIVKAAINGAASAKIPAPQINLAAVSAAPSNTGTVSPAVQMGTRPQGPPNPNLNSQYPPPQQNQVMRPTQALSGYPSRPTQGPVVQGFSGGGNRMSGPGFHNSGGTIAGSTPQVFNRGPSTSSSQQGFGNIVSGSITSRPSRPSTNVSGNGFGTDSFFGGDIFSAAPSQPKQDSSAPAFSTGSLPVPSAILPVSAGAHPSVRPNPLDYLRSLPAAQPVGGQLQPTQSVIKQNQEVLTQNTNSTYPSSGISIGPTNNASPWQKITKSDVQKYTKVFMEVDKDRDGKITGLEARNLFLSWRLPREVLMQVWDLSDQDNDSMLSLKEFCIALYLMERYREGRPLPAVLPSSIMSDFPTIGQPTFGYSNAPEARTSEWQQQQPTTGFGAQQVRPAGGARPPRPVTAPQIDEEMQTKKPKSKVPILEKLMVDQLSKEEQEALNSKFSEASEADKKVEELEKEILDSKEKIEFYRTKMQELVLYKSRCDNRLNEIIERVSGDKHEVDLLAKKYEAKCKQVGDVASKLTIEEATFRDIQERKMELYQAIVKMEEGGSADGILQARADRVQSDLDELLKSLNDRCKKYGLRVKPTALVELPFGWQPGIQEEAADWDEDWDKFEDDGFTFVKELTLDVQNVIAPPKPKSMKTQKVKPSTVESPTVASSNASKSEKLPSVDENIHENGSPANKNEDYSVRSAPESPVAKTSVESPSKEFSDSQFSVTGGADDSSPLAKESQGDYGGTNYLHSGNKGYDEPTWGTFETNDDIDSVWGFNPSSTTTDADQERHANDFFFGSGELGLNPIRTESSPENGFNQTRSSFFDDSVPSTPLYTSGYSPRQPDLSFNSFSRFDSFSSSTQDTVFFQNPQTFSRFDSMRSNNDFDQGRETLTRFDSMRSTTDLDLGRETLARFDSMRSTTDFDNSHTFQSFENSDPFGSSGPFNTSLEDQTPRRGSDNWRAF